MKRSLFLIVCVCLSFFISAYAQESMPQVFSYQAIARDATGKVLSEKKVGVKVEILKGSTTGSVVFAETHEPMSAKTGTINLLIGQGTNVKGSFAGVDWAAGPYFLQLSMDIKGGTAYEKVSTTQMMPVPYALYAAKAGTVENGGGGSTGNIRNYAIAGDNEGSDFNKMISTGKAVILNEYIEGGTYYYHVEFNFSILYLTGVDLQMSVDIEGADIGRNTSSCSCKFGHYLDFHVPVNYPQDIGKTIKLLIKDKNGNVVEEFPLIITDYKH